MHLKLHFLLVLFILFLHSVFGAKKFKDKNKPNSAPVEGSRSRSLVDTVKGLVGVGKSSKSAKTGQVDNPVPGVAAMANMPVYGPAENPQRPPIGNGNEYRYPVPDFGPPRLLTVSGKPGSVKVVVKGDKVHEAKMVAPSGSGGGTSVTEEVGNVLNATVTGGASMARLAAQAVRTAVPVVKYVGNATYRLTTETVIPIVSETLVPAAKDLAVNKAAPAVMYAAPVVQKAVVDGAEWLMKPGAAFGAGAARVAYNNVLVPAAQVGGAVAVAGGNALRQVPQWSGEAQQQQPQQRQSAGMRNGVRAVGGGSGRQPPQQRPSAGMRSGDGSGRQQPQPRQSAAGMRSGGGGGGGGSGIQQWPTMMARRRGSS